MDSRTNHDVDHGIQLAFPRNVSRKYIPKEEKKRMLCPFISCRGIKMTDCIEKMCAFYNGYKESCDALKGEIYGFRTCPINQKICHEDCVMRDEDKCRLFKKEA